MKSSTLRFPVALMYPIEEDDENAVKDAVEADDENAVEEVFGLGGGSLQ